MPVHILQPLRRWGNEISVCLRKLPTITNIAELILEHRSDSRVQFLKNHEFMLLKFLPRLTTCLSFTSFQHDTSHHHPKAAVSHLPAAARPGIPTTPLTLLSYSCRIWGVFCSTIPVLPVRPRQLGLSSSPVLHWTWTTSARLPCCWPTPAFTLPPPCFSPPALLPLPSPKGEQFPCSVLC